MAKKVYHQHDTHNVYIHYDLWQAATHLRNGIERRVKANDKTGISYDCMACSVILAFSVEAYINFLGDKLIPGWAAREEFDVKVAKVIAHLGLKPDMKQRPYSSIQRLKKFRNLIAHGQPKTKVTNRKSSKEPDDSDDRAALRALKGKWIKEATPALVAQAHEDVAKIWAKLKASSGLKDWETKPHGEGTVTTTEE